METLIKKITKDSLLKVKSQTYRPIAKVHYVTLQNPNNEYVKVFMEGHYALVMSPADNFMYFGKDIGAISDSFPTPNEITYQNNSFKKIISDYQFVKKIDFGNIIETEGEVEFVDYECISDKELIISVGRIIRTNKRADIIANVIDVSDIQIL